MMPIRVLVVDDHALFRAGVCQVLRDAGMTVVSEAGNGAEALRAVESAAIDVVLLDLHMPGGGGLSVLPTLATRARVLILTVSEATEDLHGAIREGASGYLLKNARPDQIVDAVTAVAGGQAALSPEPAARVLRLARASAVAHAPILSPREWAVAQRIARGCSNREVAAELDISANTVKTYVARIFEKYGVHNRVELAMRLRDGEEAGGPRRS